MWARMYEISQYTDYGVWCCLGLISVFRLENVADYYYFLISIVLLILVSHFGVAKVKKYLHEINQVYFLGVLAISLIVCDLLNIVGSLLQFKISLTVFFVSTLLKVGLLVLAYFRGPRIPLASLDAQLERKPKSKLISVESSSTVVPRLQEQAHLIAEQVLKAPGPGETGLPGQDNVYIQAQSQAIELGSILTDLIVHEQGQAPPSFLTAQDLLAYGENSREFVLGLFAKAVENTGTRCVIEQSPRDQLVNDACMHLLAAGMLGRKQAVFTFDFGSEQNEQILNDESTQRTFCQEWQAKIAESFAVSPNDVEVVSIARGSVRLRVTGGVTKKIFPEQIATFKATHARTVLDISLNPILKACKLSADSVLEKVEEIKLVQESQTRSHLAFHPPDGWDVYEFNVAGKYDNNNDDWLKTSGDSGEWVVAYRGLCYDPRNPITDTHSSAEGRGVYVSSSMAWVERDIEVTSLGAVGISTGYRVALMCRVNHEKIRAPISQSDFWIVDEKSIRPHRLLIKKEVSPS